MRLIRSPKDMISKKKYVIHTSNQNFTGFYYIKNQSKDSYKFFTKDERDNPLFISIIIKDGDYILEVEDEFKK